MEEIRFEIRHPDGRQERIVVVAPRAVIGSGAHCEVRLGPDQAAFEHVVVTSHPDGVHVQRLVEAPQAALDGAPFTISVIGPTSWLRLGGTYVQIVRAAVASAGPGKRLGAGALARVAVVVLAPLAVYVMQTSDFGQSSTAAPPLPDIFASGSPVCPRTDAGEARVAADELRANADGARERSPFDLREALSAVKLYELAAACYQAAGNMQAATESVTAAKELRESTTAELRARRVRLERMLAVNDYELATQDVAVLRNLTEGKKGPYVTWLINVQQHIRNQAAEHGR